MFIDQARIYVKGGDGGNGIIAFHREKFVPYGGPSGGDGGRGGHVYFDVDRQLNTLLKFKYKAHFKAKRGNHGLGSRKELGYDNLLEYLVEPTAAVFGYKDPSATAKAITQFKKEAGKQRKHLPVIKAVFMSDKLLDPDELKRLADLPSREVLLTMLVSVLEGPLQNLASYLSSPVGDFANILMAVKEKKEEE